jgi:hypothetical protein
MVFWALAFIGGWFLLRSWGLFRPTTLGGQILYWGLLILLIAGIVLLIARFSRGVGRAVLIVLLALLIIFWFLPRAIPAMAGAAQAVAKAACSFDVKGQPNEDCTPAQIAAFNALNKPAATPTPTSTPPTPTPSPTDSVTAPPSPTPSVTDSAVPSATPTPSPTTAQSTCTKVTAASGLRVLISDTDPGAAKASFQRAADCGFGGVVWIHAMQAPPESIQGVLDAASGMGLKVVLDVRDGFGTQAGADFTQKFANQPVVESVYYSFDIPQSPANPGAVGQQRVYYDMLRGVTNKPLIGAISWQAPDARIRRAQLSKVPGIPAVAFFPFPVTTDYGPVSNIGASAQDLVAIGHANGVMIVQGGAKTAQQDAGPAGPAPTQAEVTQELQQAHQGGINTVWVDLFGQTGSDTMSTVANAAQAAQG